MSKKNTIKKALLETFIRIVILIVPVTVLIFIKAKNSDLNLEDFFAVDTFVAIVFALIVESLATIIINAINKRKEDVFKLTDDYPSLVKKYSRENLFCYQGQQFPVICLYKRKYGDQPFDIQFDHSRYDRQYQLPQQVEKNSDQLMLAHKYSKVYNKLNVRLDDLFWADNTVTLVYSKTYYYDSLITNRAMDYSLSNGKTVREIYEPGPFLSSLKDSKLSNHLGYNGFLETADGKIIFVHRGKTLSIGKGTWMSSIGASLKTEYALTEKKQLTKDRLSYAIIKEIQDELYIELPENIDFTKHIIAFYRDLVEGGKPQFLFYYKLHTCTFKDFEKAFRRTYNQKDNKVDGTEFLGLTLDECRMCRLTASGFTYRGVEYKMTASAAASLAMLLDYFEGNEEKE